MVYPYIFPDLEDRFLPDNNWQTGSFISTKTGHKIHYASSKIDDASGSIAILPGLSEFTEKYVETVKYFNSRGYNCYVMDWSYQGRSTRLLENRHKRYSDGYDKDIDDLDFFIKTIIKNDHPLFMLGHSMGGHLGLRYLATRENNIKAASFSAPMIDILALKIFPSCFAFILRWLDKKYVLRGKNWQSRSFKDNSDDIFSEDPIRNKINNAWSISNPALQVGNVTCKWLYESIKSIKLLNKINWQEFKTPILMAYGSEEMLVDNNKLLKIARKIPKSRILKIEKSKHEILMERDFIRNEFLDETIKLFNQ